MIHSPEQPLPHSFTTIVADDQRRGDGQRERTYNNSRPQRSHEGFLSIAKCDQAFETTVRSDAERTAHHAGIRRQSILCKCHSSDSRSSFENRVIIDVERGCRCSDVGCSRMMSWRSNRASTSAWSRSTGSGASLSSIRGANSRDSASSSPMQ